jgi:hypothetical protein
MSFRVSRRLQRYNMLREGSPRRIGNFAVFLTDMESVMITYLAI